MHPKIRRIEIEYKEDLSLEFIEGLIETAMPTTIFGNNSILLKSEISLLDLIFILVHPENANLLGYVWLKKQVFGYWKLHKSVFLIEDDEIDIEKHIISKIIQDQFSIQILNINIQNKIKDLETVNYREDNIFYSVKDYYASYGIILFHQQTKNAYKGLESYYDNDKPVWPYSIRQSWY